MNHRARSVVALAFGTATAAAAPAPPVVRLFVTGTPDAVAGTRDALRDRCARPHLVIVVEDATPPALSDADTWTGAGTQPYGAGASQPDVDVTSGADTSPRSDAPPHADAATEAHLLASGLPTDLAVGYVALEPAAGSRVVLVDGRTHDELERRILEPTASLEMSIETVAHVICATIDSTLATETAEPAPIPPPLAAPVTPPLPTHAPAKEAESPFGAWAGVFGTGTDYGAGFRGGGGGMFGATTGSSRLRASLVLLASDFPAFALDREGAAPSIGLFGARLLPGVALRAADDIDALFGVGPGIDWLRVAPGTPPPGGTAESGVNSVDPVISALLGTRLRVGGHVALWLGLGADLDAYRHRYVNAANGTSVPFFELPRLRANGQAGLAVTFGRDVSRANPTLTTTEVGSTP